MRDFNFFSPYLLKKRNKRLKNFYIFSVSALLIIGLLSFYTLNNYYINKYKSEISTVENYLNSEKTKKLLNLYEDTKKKTEIVNTYYNKMSEIDRVLRAQNVVSTNLLNKLASVMPQDSYILSCTISNRDIVLNYSITDLVPIAELEHNLRELDIFEKVHISIVNSGTSYNAIISCSLKDVNIDETKTNE